MLSYDFQQHMMNGVYPSEVLLKLRLETARYSLAEQMAWGITLRLLL